MDMRSIGRIARAFVFAGVFLAFVSIPPSSLTGMAIAAGKPVRARHLIEHPRAGQRVLARPLLIRIRARRHARVGTRLNGRPIAKYLSRPSRRGLRRLRASPSHGLRHGRNVLWVRVRPRGAGRARVQRVRFRVTGERPLAAAGLDRRVGQHARFRLSGRRSRPRPTRRSRPLRYRWELLRAPRGSRLWRRTQGSRRRAKRRAARRVRNLGPPPKLRRLGAVKPRLRLDHPGVYRFRLNVIDPDGIRGTDQVSLRVDPPPLVPIDTMAKPKGTRSWGVRVGTQFYPDPGKNQQWLQVVVLKSETQELISNTSYNCPQATAHPHATELEAVKKCTERVRADILKLSNHNVIVIAVSQRVNGKMARTKPWQVQPPVGFWTAIDGMGADVEDEDHAHAGTPLLRGRISAVWRVERGSSDIPDRLVAAHDHYDLDRVASGEVAGFLVRDNVGSYSGFRAAEQPGYETQATGSVALANVMRIGSKRYPSETNDGHTIIQSGEGGFQAVMVDPESLQGASETFRTRLKECGGECAVEVGEMKEWIETEVRQGRTLLFLASIGDPRLDPSNIEEQKRREAENAAAAGLVSLLANQFGATYNRVYRTLHDTGSTPPGPRSYSLVANHGTPAGFGLEREGAAGASGGNTVPQSGSLAHGKDYAFEPEAGLTSGKLGDAGAKLREVAYSQPSSWPEQGNRGRSTAISWVGERVGIDSRRSLYWTQPYGKHGEGFWNAKKGEIKELAYPKLVGFSKADFEWAQTEFALEIRWLEAAHSLSSTLATPFTKGQLTAWGDVENIASTIQESVTAPEIVTKSDQEALVALDFAGETVEAIPLVGNIVKAVAAGYKAVEGLVRIREGGGDATGGFQAKVGKFGKQLSERLELAQEAIEDQLTDVIVADYRKLKTVGLCAELSKACPDGPLEQWQFTQVEQEKAAPAVERGIETLIYAALLPTKYEAWLLPLSPHTATSHDQGHQVAGQTALSGFYCAFHPLPLSAQVAYPIHLNVESVPGGDTWRVAAYGHRFFDKGRWRMEKPTGGATDPLFNAISEEGLGANPEVFYRRAWNGGAAAPEGLSDYPETGSKVQWIEKDNPIGLKPECDW